MFSQTLPAADSHSARRFEYHSDGDDDYLPFPGAREPPETAFQSSGYADGKGLDGLSLAAKITSGSQGKGKISGKPRAYRSSRALPQHSGPFRLTAGPFSGPLKATGKPNMALSIIPADAIGKKKPCFDANEPTSPEVTCLGRVRINSKYMNGAAEEKPCADGRKPEHGKVSGSKKQSDDRKCKARKSKGAGEKVRCLRRRASRQETEFAQVDFHTDLKHLSSALPAAEPSETVETRRERAATLARSLTSLLEDLRRFEKEDTEYVPPVPPPNSLLLMRGFRKAEKPPQHASMSQLKMKKTTMADENGFLCRTKKNTMVDEHVRLSEINMRSRNSLAEQVSLSQMKMEKNTMAEHVALSQMDTMAAEVNYAIAQQAPLSEIKNNAMSEHIPSSEMKNKSMDCCQVSLLRPDPGATLWQRRAIANLAAIEIKKPIKMEVNKPSTK